MKNELTADQLRQEITVTLPLGVLLTLGESRTPPVINVMGEPASPQSDSPKLPAIGAALSDGIYAGLSIESERPVALILLPGDEELKFDDAVEWAQKQGGVLPSRIDQLVLFKNLRDKFQPAWYWSGEQCAGGESFAWCQDFLYGTQDGLPKDDELRARAVRRLPL